MNQNSSLEVVECPLQITKEYCENELSFSNIGLLKFKTAEMEAPAGILFSSLADKHLKELGIAYLKPDYTQVVYFKVELAKMVNTELSERQVLDLTLNYIHTLINQN